MLIYIYNDVIYRREEIYLLVNKEEEEVEL